MIKLDKYHQRVLDLLREKGELGLTVIECMQLGGGTELRKVVSDLVKPEFGSYNIITKWKSRASKRFKKYYLIEKQKEVFKPEIALKTEPLKGEVLQSWQEMGAYLRGEASKPAEFREQIVESLF